jgi:tripartite-type tricarboxylate transporter receptor subunit TctC
VGSSMHLAMELLKQRAGLDLLHVPFKGSSPAYPEVFSGRVDLLIDPLFPTLNHVKAGKLKALALTGSQHPAVAPDISLIADLYPGFNVPSLFGLVVASSTPREVVHKLHADVSAVLREPPIRKRLDELGLDPHPLTPEQFDALIKSEVEGWIGFVRKAGISKD